MEENEVKKSKQKKKMIDDIEELPEELDKDYSEGVEDPDEESEDGFVADDEEPLPDEEYPDLEDTTEEIMVDDFHRFKESVSSDWEG